MFQIEDIPDEDYLYMRVHRTRIDEDGEPFPHAFSNFPKGAEGMSTDWSKHSTPLDSKNRGRVPNDNAIIKFLAGKARKISGQIVEHRPEDYNQAHSEVVGEKTTAVREQFMEIYEREIPLA